MDATTKRCTDCGETKPLAEFHRSKKTLDGRIGRCKPCQKVYREMKRRTAGPLPAEKLCATCGETKPLEAFYTNRSAVDGRTTQCADCMKGYTRQWVAQNREQAIETTRRWRAENQEHRRRYKRSRREIEARQKRERYWARDEAYRERLRAAYRDWYRRNPYTGREQAMRWVAKGLGVLVETVSYEAVLLREGLICHICGDEIALDDLHFDHIVPLSRGGAHAESNIGIAHAACNLRKGNKLLSELD